MQYVDNVDALETAITVWEWIAEHPGECKEDAYMVLFPDTDLELEGDLSSCSLCQISYDSTFMLYSSQHCDRCPAKEEFEQYEETDYTHPGTYCLKYHTPYADWSEALMPDGASIAATAMVELLQRALTRNTGTSKDG
jgi:hypothetical protein